MSYDLTNLSPADFEELSRDLLQAELGLVLESFATGPDQGIDFRHSKAKDAPTIVQCKHYAKSGWRGLQPTLEGESEKAKRLSPSRYILVTSASLTPANKDRVAALFPNCVARDVLGYEDVQNLLNRHRQVLDRHFKLWLGSTEVLRRILHNDVITRSEREVEELRQQVRLFVSNDSFQRALEMLSSQHVCVIAGVPGIGKTMLARMLMLHHMEQGFTAIVISSDVGEADRVYSGQEKQIFYYDDFLGTSFDEAALKNEDSRLARFMRAVSHASNKRLILTTREYILQDARMRYEKLFLAVTDTLKCVVSLEDYTALIRGKILYNHLYFSAMSAAQRRAVCEPAGYGPILAHRNFSPRLVEHGIAHVAARSIPPSEVVSHFERLLSNPETLWDHAFRFQITSAARAILLALLTLREAATVDLEVCASAISAVSRDTLTHEAYLHELKRLEGTFIAIGEVRSFLRLGRQSDIRVVRFHGPAVLDYLLHYVNSDPSLVSVLVGSAQFFEQLTNLGQTAAARDLASTSISFRFPGLARALALCDKELCEALTATMGKASSEWSYALPQGTPQRREVTPEMRLLAVADLQSVLQLPALAAWLDAAILARAPNWTRKEGAVRDALKLVSRVAVEAELEENVRDWFLDTASEAADFDFAADLLDVIESESDFRERVLEQFQEFVSAESDYILDYADSRDAAESAMDEVQRVAKKLGVEPRWNDDRLQERLVMLSAPEDSFDSSRAREAHRDSPSESEEEDKTEDQEIALLFGSMLHDEPAAEDEKAG